MKDTGGISKNRQKEPEFRPPRSDSQNRYRTKDKPSEQRDKDVDSPDKDKTASANVESKARSQLASTPKTFKEAVQRG
jgi:hypothetical protein